MTTGDTMQMPKLLAALLTGCVLAALTPLGAAQAGTGPAIYSASLTSGGKPCSATTPPVMQGYFASLLEAAGSDDTYSSSGFDYTFSIWPLADPAAARSVTAHGYSSGSLVHAQLPADVLSDGNSYAWRVQVATSNGTSPWSQVCTFSYDTTDPATPTVSSANYPPYGEGVAPADQFGQFTFDAGGDPDTVGFYYAWTQDLPAYGCSYGGPLGQLVCPDVITGPNTVRVTSPGGTASITLAPVSDGPQILSVAALDAAGNRSPAVRYQTFVPGSAPIISRPGNRPSSRRTLGSPPESAPTPTPLTPTPPSPFRPVPTVRPRCRSRCAGNPPRSRSPASAPTDSGPPRRTCSWT
jgi:hypothetical protein